MSARQIFLLGFIIGSFLSLCLSFCVLRQDDYIINLANDIIIIRDIETLQKDTLKANEDINQYFINSNE